MGQRERWSRASDILSPFSPINSTNMHPAPMPLHGIVPGLGETGSLPPGRRGEGEGEVGTCASNMKIRKI